MKNLSDKHTSNEGNYVLAFSQSRERLRNRTLEEIVEETKCQHLGSNKLYLVSFGSAFEILYPEGKVKFADTKTSPPMNWSLIILNYLASAKNLDITGEWVTYRDLPSGNVFFPNIKNNVIDVLSRYYSQYGRAFMAKRLEQLDFTLQNTGADLVAKGSFAPRIPVMVKFWAGEEGLPPACQILLDSSVHLHMHMEDVAAILGLLGRLLTDPLVFL